MTSHYLWQVFKKRAYRLSGPAGLKHNHQDSLAPKTQERWKPIFPGPTVPLLIRFFGCLKFIKHVFLKRLHFQEFRTFYDLKKDRTFSSLFAPSSIPTASPAIDSAVFSISSSVVRIFSRSSTIRVESLAI